MHELNQETVVEKVFKKAAQEFQSSLKSTYSVMMKVIKRDKKKNFCAILFIETNYFSPQQNDTSSITSEDLVRNFENILINIIKVDRIHANFPVAMGINAFEGWLNEFKSSRYFSLRLYPCKMIQCQIFFNLYCFRSQSGPKVAKVIDIILV